MHQHARTEHHLHGTWTQCRFRHHTKPTGQAHQCWTGNLLLSSDFSLSLLTTSMALTSYCRSEDPLVLRSRSRPESPILRPTSAPALGTRLATHTVVLPITLFVFCGGQK